MSPACHNSRATALHKKCDTTDFKSCGEFNFLARRGAEFLRYPPALAAWSFNFVQEFAIIGPN